MKLPDDVRSFWQEEDLPKENHRMWQKLIEEKRSGFDRLVRAENKTEYLAALMLGPLLVWLAWNAKFPWVQAGFALLASAFIALSIGTWFTQPRHQAQSDDSLRDHLEGLVDGYNRRIRFMRSGKLLVSLMLSGGLVAVIMGVPGDVTKVSAWCVVVFVLACFLGAQRVSYRRAVASLLAQREEASFILRDLRDDPSQLTPGPASER